MTVTHELARGATPMEVDGSKDAARTNTNMHASPRCAYADSKHDSGPAPSTFGASRDTGGDLESSSATDLKSVLLRSEHPFTFYGSPCMDQRLKKNLKNISGT